MTRRFSSMRSAFGLYGGDEVARRTGDADAMLVIRGRAAPLVTLIHAGA
jgi:hypothetical protein